MAQYKKKNSKSGAASKKKKSTAASRSRAAVNKTNPRNRELSGIIIIALGILLLVSVLLSKEGSTGGLGAVGGFLAELMRLTAGQAAVIFPIFLLVFGGLVFADRYTGMWNGRLLGLSLVLLAVLALLHLKVEMLPWADYMQKDLLVSGGGALGAVIAFAAQKLFGRVLSTILLIFVLLIGVLLLTQISLKQLFSGIYHKTSDFFSGLKPDEATLAERERLREERAQRARETRAATAKAEKKPEKEKASARRSGIYDPGAQNDFERSGRGKIFVADNSGNAFSPVITDGSGAANINPDKNRFGKDYLPDITDEAGDKKADKVLYEKKAPAGKADGKPDELAAAEKDAAQESASAAATAAEIQHEYVLPSPELMSMPVNIRNPRMERAITDSVSLLETTLRNFGVGATVTQVVSGPSVTRYELQPAPGVRVSRVVNLTDDIALALAAPDVRIEAPIPGRSVIGIEVPHEGSSTVYFREVIESEAFKNAKSKISFALGQDISGNYIVGDLAKMPHLLVAGATGTGKSVCINSFICSILYKAKPDEVKFLLIDPKKVEMSNYAGLPHLNSPVVTDAKKAAASLKWVVSEMENRYDIFASDSVRNFDEYNAKHPEKPFCHIVVIIDELADLMMTSKDEVEQSICRLAQMARAAGIHLVIATQRPSVNVLTGLIKANIPSRIAFAVASDVDSRTILGMNGAERLIGRGDMLYSPIGTNKPIRVQGTYISDKDVEQLVLYCKAQAKPQYCEEISAVMEAAVSEQTKGSHERTADDKDPLFYEAARLVINTGQASTSYLQRRFSIGNPRAGRLVDCLADNGVVSGPDGSKPRTVLMTLDEFEEKFGGAQ